MPAYQRTFDLIPTTLASPTVYRPPMTSKAAKRAYAKKNAGPKISRVDQKRLEKEELERQKKEFEREKALNKARAAREKKAEKERKEREERKKRGEPEPKKGIRASQSRISVFVRGESTGSKRKWEGLDCAESDSEGTIGDVLEEKRNHGPPAKKVAIEDDSEDETEPAAEATMMTTRAKEKEAAAQGPAVIEDSEDEFGDFPTLSQSDLLEKLDASTPVRNTKEAVLQCSNPIRKPPEDLIPPHESPELPRHKAVMEDDIFDDAMLEEMLTTQIMSEAAEASLKSDAIEPQPSPRGSAAATEAAEMSLIEETPIPQTERRVVNNQYYKAPSVKRLPLQDRSSNMPPPKLPSRVMTKPRVLSNTTRRSESRQQNHNRHIKHTVNSQSLPSMPSQPASKLSSMAPPSATQAFLEDHIDDFFPSPTQQIRELLDDIRDDDFPSNTQIAKDISPRKFTAKVLEPEFVSPSRLPAISQTIFKDPYFGDLFCTQDLAMSSQEEAELKSPSHPVQKVQANKELEHKPAHASIRPKGKFFEEKEEDLYLAALQESKMPAEKEAQRRSPPHRELQKKSGSRYDQLLATEYTDDGIFQDDEDTLVQVAINESKLEAERKAEVQPTTLRPQQNPEAETNGPKKVQSPSDYGDEDDFFSDDDTLVGVLNESHTAIQQPRQAIMVQQKVPLRKDDAPRTMKRIQSMSSDYGDDDFCGWSQELAAMC